MPVTTANGKVVDSDAVVVDGLAVVEPVPAEGALAVVAGPGLPVVHAATSITPNARAVPRNILGEFTATA
jgi:hypothetical protein